MDKKKDAKHSFDPNRLHTKGAETKEPSSNNKDIKNNKHFGRKSSTRAHKKASDRQRVEALRAQNAQTKEQAYRKKQARKATLDTLSKEDKKTFLAAEKNEKHREKAHARAEKARQRRAYWTLTPEQKATYRKDTRHQKKLQNRAKKGYVARQIVKYALLAAVIAGLVWVGLFAYGVFVDNSYAFQDSGTAQLTAPPTPETTDAPVATHDASETTVPTSTISPYDMLLSQADIDFLMQDRVNILVLGIDESLERENWGSFRTDTMIFMSIDFANNDVAMISLPRDSYVWIYGKNYRQRINTAFASGGGKDGSGFEYAMNTVSLLLGGVPVNHYVCFDMNVVKEVVNAMGGLYYDVDIEFTMCGRPYELGYQYMDGQAVLDYCRERHVDSDIGRTARQRAMIMAIFQEMKNTGQIQDVPDIYTAVTGNIYTDLSFSQICSLAAFAMDLDMEGIHEYALPGDYLNIDGTSLWGINQYKKRDMVSEIFGIDISVSREDHVTYLQELAAQKRQAVEAAEAAAVSAQSYVDANMDDIEAAELSEFNTKKTELLVAAAVKDIHDVGSTIQPVIDATDTYNAWFEGTFKPTIDARKAATPTPTGGATPEPTGDPTPTPTDDPVPTDTPAPTT